MVIDVAGLISCTQLICEAHLAAVVQVPFNSLGPVYQVLNKHDAQQRTEEYLTSGEVLIKAEVALDSFADLQHDMLDATAGSVSAEQQRQ